MKKLALTAVLLVLSGISAFAKPVWSMSLDAVLPIEFYSAGKTAKVNYTDVSIAGGMTLDVFFTKNFGFFFDFGIGGRLSHTVNGRAVSMPNPFGVIFSGGPAFRIPLQGTPMSISIGLGPRFSTMAYTIEKLPEKVTRERLDRFFVRVTTFPAGQRTRTIDTPGLVLKPSLLIAGNGFFFDFGVNIGFNLSKRLTDKEKRGSEASKTLREETLENYFGFVVTPKIRFGASF